jgi:hypothetical protein
MDKFVAQENIRFLHDRLQTETDPAARSLLQQLLIDEEDQLEHNCEALHEIETLIAHVNRQQALLVSRERDGHDTGQALTLLTAYSEILLVCENQREKILIKLRQSRL